MNFNDCSWKAIKTEEERKQFREEAKCLTCAELSNKYEISKSKMYTILRFNNIKAKRPERPKKPKVERVKRISEEDREIKHWALTFNNGRIRSVYYNIIKRCYKKDNKGYKSYGGRGITVCDEWKNNHLSFFRWAKENGYKEGLTIDRIDNNKGYSPENCRWTTYKAQTENRRCTRWIEFNNEKHTLKDWAEIIGISYSVLSDRIFRYNWTIERALTT